MMNGHNAGQSGAKTMLRGLLLVVICILAMSGLRPADALKCFKCTGPGCSNPEKIQSVPCTSGEDTCLVGALLLLSSLSSLSSSRYLNEIF